MHIERALIDRLGDVGRKLHTARSRNDQVATDLRLWVREAIDHDRRPAGRAAAGVGRPLRARRRRDPARLYPPAAGAAGAGRRTIGWPIAKSSSATAAGWPIAGARTNVLQPGRRGAGRHEPADRPRRSWPASWGSTRWRPTASTPSSDRDFVLEFAFCLSADRRASEHLGRRMDPLVDRRVQLPQACRRRFAPARRSCRKRSIPTCWS